MLTKLKTKPPAEPPTRENLRFWHAELSAAVTEEGECIASLARLRSHVEVGSKAEEESVAKIVASRGNDFEDASEIAHKIAKGKLAEAAIPRAEQDLATAQAEVSRLRAEVTRAAKGELLAAQSVAIAQYERRLASTIEAYSYMVGVRAVLYGDAATPSIEAPRFGRNTEVGRAIHPCTDSNGNPRAVTRRALADYQRALEGLISSPDFDLSNLVAECRLASFGGRSNCSVGVADVTARPGAISRGETMDEHLQSDLLEAATALAFRLCGADETAMHAALASAQAHVEHELRAQVGECNAAFIGAQFAVTVLKSIRAYDQLPAGGNC